MNFLIPSNFEKAMDAFKNDKKLGMTADFRVIYRKPRENDKRTFATAKELLVKYGYSDEIAYVGGTMFLARAKLFETIRRIGLTENDFNVFESSVSNDKIEYVLERVLGSVIIAQGYELRDTWTSGLRKFSLRLLWYSVYMSRKMLRLICNPTSFGLKNRGISGL